MYFDRLYRSIKVQAEVMERVERAGGKVIALGHHRRSATSEEGSGGLVQSHGSELAIRGRHPERDNFWYARALQPAVRRRGRRAAN